MSETRNPTLKTIADSAKVSSMTVSLALRNSPKISDATKLRIATLAAKLGYRQNSFAASLVSLRTSATPRYRGTLAVLNCHSKPRGWQESPTFIRIYQGAREHAAELGYQLDEFWLNDPAVSMDRLRRTLFSRGVPGVILAFFDGQRETLRRLHAFDLSSFANVSMGRRIEEMVLHAVTNDQYHSANLATRKLYELGYRRVGLMLDQRVDGGLEHRFRGGYLAERDTWPLAKPIPVIEAVASVDEHLRWIERHRLDAVLSFHNDICRRLTDAGIDIPGQLGFACLDYLIPGENVAGVDQKSGYVGAAAVDMIVAQIHRGECGTPAYQKSLMIRGEWVDGWSVRHGGASTVADGAPGKRKRARGPTLAAGAAGGVVGRKGDLVRGS